MARVTEQDREEFKQYLQQCTDAQVQGVLERETEADRRTYMRLAQDELNRRTEHAA